MMSYLAPDFNPDVFVSYSHGDPRGSRAPLRAWTQATIRRLEDHIHSLEPEFRDLRLWMDPDFDPTAKLTEELRKQISGSGVLMIVMSKHYLESEWCKDELGWFKEQVQNRRVAAGRVFIIRAQETDTNRWPAFLRDERGHAIPGFVFYDSEDGSSPLSFDLKEPGEDYLRALNPLRTWLVRRLRELRSAVAKRPEPEKGAAPTPPGREKRRIYLYARPDDDSKRVDVARALYQDGIVPLTSTHPGGRGRLPDWLSEDSGRLNEARTCEALALLRAVGGDRFRDDLLYVGVTERERIAGARGAPLPCAVLDATSESLPIDVVPFGIERFDVNQTGWLGHFRGWLDAAGAPTAGSVP
jgi:hypothetical protein